jgi:hypothetical protein
MPAVEAAMVKTAAIKMDLNFISFLLGLFKYRPGRDTSLTIGHGLGSFEDSIQLGYTQLAGCLCNEIDYKARLTTVDLELLTTIPFC